VSVAAFATLRMTTPVNTGSESSQSDRRVSQSQMRTAAPSSRSVFGIAPAFRTTPVEQSSTDVPPNEPGAETGLNSMTIGDQ